MTVPIMDLFRTRSGIDISPMVDSASIQQWPSNPAGFNFKTKFSGAIDQIRLRLEATPTFGKVTFPFDRIVKDDKGHRRFADYAFRECGRHDSLHIILFKDSARFSTIHLDSHSVAIAKDSINGSVVYSEDVKDLVEHVQCDLLHHCK